MSYPYKYPQQDFTALPYIRSDYLRSLARIFHELKSVNLPYSREHAEVPTEGLTEG